MPFQVGGVSLHDDYQHTGSAARDVVSGVAGIGAGGQLLAPGPDVELTRDGSENIEIVERTSGNIVYRWTRIGVNDFECRINCGGVACKMLNDSLIDAANGIAGLDASVEVPIALLKTNVANGIAGLDASADVLLAQIPDILTGKETNLNAVISSGTFTGNNTVNRAIAHGLGRTPKILLMGYASDGRLWCHIAPGKIGMNEAVADVSYTVTQMDSTNFYVGNASQYTYSGNGGAIVYCWVVIG